MKCIFVSNFTNLVVSCTTAGLPSPTLEQYHGELAIPLWRLFLAPSQSRTADTTSPPQNDNVPVNVLDLARLRSGINRRQLAQMIEVDVKTIARAVNDFVRLIEHRGRPKTGGYHLVLASSDSPSAAAQEYSR